MNTRSHSIINIVATVLLATVLLCIGLFWARWLCSVTRAESLPPSAREVTIHPSRDVRTDEGADPNLLAPPRVTARMQDEHPLLMGLGALHYLLARAPGMPAGPPKTDHIYRWESGPDGEQLYFDASLGLIVRKGTGRFRDVNGKQAVRHFTYYAGPEGASTTPDGKLGRFVSPIADGFLVQPQTVYDRALRRFFAISWREDNLTVRKGPELPKDVPYQPVQIGAIQKGVVSIGIPAPDKLVDGKRAPMSAYWSAIWPLRQVLVLDASGRIDWLDTETLDVHGPAACLPIPAMLFGSRRSVARPEEVAAYVVTRFHCASSDAAGTAIATLSREGLALQLDYFDANGVRIAGDGTTAPRCGKTAYDGEPIIDRVPSEKAAYHHYVGLTAAKFLLENLHPPALVLLSYFRGSRFEATAGYRSVFLLPDSFVAMVARAGGDVTPWERFFWALAYMVPGLLLCGLLAVKLDREGVRAGVPKNARRAWIAGTITLGLPAYITYRLTRPKATLVTCQNCGLGRRPDLEKCHRCGSVWAVPELIPPAWRVLGEPEQTEETSASRAEESGSPA